MPEPTFKVRQRRDPIHVEQEKTWKSNSSGPMPKNSGVVEFSTTEYNKPVEKEEKKSEK